MKETKTLEFKEVITNSFLKTVSAYANYGTGEILFGITNDGKTVGINNTASVCLDIENKINDSIDPSPEYRLSIDERTKVIRLTVIEGMHKPYFYKSKAYRRHDTATVEVDRLELNRLILEGQNKSFESLRSKRQDLNFSILENKMKEIVGINDISIDILKTLELYNSDVGYTVAGELLADQNSFNGIDIVRFGDSINIMLDRETYQCVSLLEQYDKSLSVYRKYYQYEKIAGSKRQLVEMVPEEAFREAVANALVHRTWDVKAQIRIAMYPEKIDIISPGGLIKGVDEEEYLSGQLSILRNPIIGNVFFRLKIIEKFGTGVRRIRDSYSKSAIKPLFDIFDNSIKVSLPVIGNCSGLKDDQRRVYQTVVGRSASSSEIVEKTGFGKTKVTGLLKQLVAQGYVTVIGSGRGTKYTAT